MLSILIPTYNHTCTPLVSQLLQMGEQYDIEIVVAEDGTTDPQALASNQWIAQMPRCRYLPYTENHGRAGIRNLLAQEAHGDRLLFLDDDVTPASSDYIYKYIETDAPVVCGGIWAAATPQPSNLRWKYDKASERKLTPERRNQHPYLCFSTANFCIMRDVFLKIQFDENIKQYGYEDALFGIRLLQMGIKVVHIAAPVHHNGLDTNRDFLVKVETAIDTLHQLPQMQAYAAVAKASRRLAWIAPLIRLAAPLMRRNLLGKHPQVLLLQLYKLAIYTRRQRPCAH